MASRKMKRNRCTTILVFRAAGGLLLFIGAILAIFWPMIVDVLLARVGHGEVIRK